MIPGQASLHLSTPVLPDCGSPEAHLHRRRRLWGAWGLSGWAPSKGMFPFPAPSPRAEASARRLPLSKPPAPVLTLFGLVSDGFKVRGQNPWVPATQALGVGSLSSARPADSFRTASAIPDPSSPCRSPSTLPGVSPHPPSGLPSVPHTRCSTRWPVVSWPVS